MTTLSPRQQQINDDLMMSDRPDIGIVEGMGVAFDEGLRSSIGASIYRGIQNVFDTSEKINPVAANEQFGLEGTDYAFKPDEVVSVEKAKAVADDFHRSRLNEYISDTVNQESPILGRATQFAAGLAGAMVDPVTLPVNIAGGLAVNATVKGLVNSRRAFNILSKMSPATAGAFNKMYAEGVQRSVSNILLREGLENFAGSAIESSVQFAGVGNERLARDITKQEALFNVLAGTAFGTVFGTVASREGRQAIKEMYYAKYGDAGAEYLDNHLKIGTAEMQAGIERSTFDSALADREEFAAKPWMPGHSYEYVNAIPETAYIPVKQDKYHAVSGRGQGTVLTDNIFQAGHHGDEVIPVDLKTLKLATNDSRDVVKSLAQRTFTVKDAAAVSRVLKKRGIDGDVVDPVRAIKRTLSVEKDLDSAVEFLQMLRAAGAITGDTYKQLDSVLEKAGYDGYTFTGKGKLGHNAYNGVYVHPNATAKMAKKESIKFDPPGEGDKIKWNQQTSEMFRQYENWARTTAKPITKQEPTITPRVASNVGETPANIKPAENASYEVIAKNSDIREEAARMTEAVQRELEQAGEEGASPDLVKKAEKLKALQQPDAKVRIEQESKASKFFKCLFGAE